VIFTKTKEKKTPREILGVSENAGLPEIKEAYRKLSLEWHPDKNKSPKAEERYKEITCAYAAINEEPAKTKDAAYSFAENWNAANMWEKVFQGVAEELRKERTQEEARKAAWIEKREFNKMLKKTVIYVMSVQAASFVTVTLDVALSAIGVLPQSGADIYLITGLDIVASTVVPIIYGVNYLLDRLIRSLPD